MPSLEETFVLVSMLVIVSHNATVNILLVGSKAIEALTTNTRNRSIKKF